MTDIDPFTYMAPPLKIRALSAALGTGLIDHLRARPASSLAVMATQLGLHPRGSQLLTGLLLDHGLLVRAPGAADALSLSASLQADLASDEEFVREVVSYMDKVYRDLSSLEDAVRTGAFEGEVRRFWTYRGKDEAQAQHEPLLRVLTRQAGRSIVAAMGLTGQESVLDAGGNSGTFATRILERHPAARCAVFDLPGPCAEGRRRFAEHVAAGQLRFFEGDFQEDAFPGGFEVVVFKGVLNDWPDQMVPLLLQKARAALAPGGRLVVVEHMQGEWGAEVDAWFDLSFMYLIEQAREFRTKAFYSAALEALGGHVLASVPVPVARMTLVSATFE